MNECTIVLGMGEEIDVMLSEKDFDACSYCISHELPVDIVDIHGIRHIINSTFIMEVVAMQEGWEE